MRKGPQFLICGRFGVYYFQRRVPPAFKTKFATVPTFVRLSLQTNKRSHANKLARVLSVMWDLRAKQFFKSEEDFHRGMKLLVQYLSASSAGQSFEQVSRDFLDHLDDTTDYETYLLNQAAQYQVSKQIDAGGTPHKTTSTAPC